jgi:hypothetical protein
MEASDMIFDNDNNAGITSGGFSVNSIMMKMGLSPLVTINTQSGGASVSDMFSGIVVPNWAFTHNNMTAGNPEDDDKVDKDVDKDDEVIQDDIYDKLLDVVKHYDKKHPKKQTKKIKTKKGSKNTRKNT